MVVTINGNLVDYKHGITITEKLTEDLDTGTLILPQQALLSLEPFDQVVVVDTSFIKNMLIGDIKRTTKRFGTTKEYEYLIGLVSPTIQLQRIVLPNRSITQPLAGTKTTAYTVLNQYRIIYAPSMTFSSALITLLSSYDCPEFQWNRPTLFEVFNDVLSEADAVVTMSSFTEISYLDLNTTGSTIDESKLAEATSTQSVMEYANKIEAEVENAVVGTRNTRVIQWIVPKTDEDSIVTTNNFKLILEKNIYKLNSLTQKIYYDSTETSGDVTTHVAEKKVYDLLLPSTSGSVITGDYKRDYYYFEEGKNTIEGLSYNEDDKLGISTLKAISNVFSNVASVTIPNSECLNFAFKVDYQAQETVKLISNKKHNTTYNSTLINNQDTSYVDFKAFSKKQQNTINRLGNETLILQARYDTIAEIPELGDIYDTDYKLAIREYSIYNDYVVFKGTCAKNYVLKDLFTGIKSERRYTKIASESEAFESNHIEEINLNLSNTNATTSAALEEYLMDFGKADNGIEVIAFTTDSNDEVLVAPSAYWTENSLILTWKMADNFNAGISSDTAVNFGGETVGIYNTPYVDSNGKFNYYGYKLYKSASNDDLDSPTTGADWALGVETARKFPLYSVLRIDLNDLIFSDTSIYRYKDNREITVETKQFNITTDSNVIVGKKFFKNNSLTYSGSSDKAKYVAYSLTETYEDGANTNVGTIADPSHLTYSRTNNYYRISSPDSSIDISALASWAIVDGADLGDGNLILANNGNSEYIYLNKEA